MKIVTRTLDGIKYCIRKDVYDYYFTNMIITYVDDNHCKVEVCPLNKSFIIPLTTTKAVESIDTDGEILNQLFKLKDFPRSEFFALTPPRLSNSIAKRKTFFERLFS